MDEQQNASAKPNTKLIWGAIIVITVLWLGYSFFSPTQKPSETGPVRIGAMLALTGDAAVYGEPMQRIMQLAADEMNAHGGIGGRRLEIIFEDDKCSGKDGANAIQKLINVDKVQAVIGGICSSATLAAAPIAEAAKVLLFSPGASSPDLTGKSPYFFRDYPSDATQGRVLGELAYQTKGWRKVAFIQEQLDYPLGIYKAFSATFQGLGGTVVKEEFAIGVTDFRTQLTKLKAAQPDALFIATQAPAASERILKQLAELKWQPALLISDATAGDQKTVANNRNLLEGALAAEFGIDPSNAKFAAMLVNYKAKFGEDMPYQSYGQTEYDAVYLLRDGIVAVGYNGEKLAAWSRTIKDWQGASGSVTIEASGDRASGHVAKVIRSGKVELFEP